MCACERFDATVYSAVSCEVVFPFESFAAYNSKLFDSLAKHTEEVQESKAEIQKELDKDAQKVRICDGNETEEIFRLALFIILVDFLGLALDGFLTIASSGLVSTRFLL